MKIDTKAILGYEKFCYAHNLHEVPLPAQEKKRMEQLFRKTARHYKKELHLSDLGEAIIFSSLFHAYLLGKQREQ